MFPLRMGVICVQNKQRVYAVHKLTVPSKVRRCQLFCTLLIGLGGYSACVAWSLSLLLLQFTILPSYNRLSWHLGIFGIVALFFIMSEYMTNNYGSKDTRTVILQNYEV